VLDKYEKNLSDLFDDPEFLSLYGKLLRMVYIGYIPFFYRILLLIGITIFQDTSFQIAKKKIIADQEVLARINKEKQDSTKERKLAEKRERVSRVDDLEKVNQIMEVLDAMYLVENYIPTIEEIKARLSGLESSVFHATIEKHHFQIIPPTKTGPAEEILLYPLNHEWRTKAARLRRVVDKILLESGESDAGQSERAKRLQKVLSKKDKPLAMEQQEEDPYERFGKEVKKYEENQKQDESEGG